MTPLECAKSRAYLKGLNCVVYFQEIIEEESISLIGGANEELACGHDNEPQEDEGDFLGVRISNYVMERGYVWMALDCSHQLDFSFDTSGFEFHECFDDDLLVC